MGGAATCLMYVRPAATGYRKQWVATLVAGCSGYCCRATASFAFWPLPRHRQIRRRRRLRLLERASSPEQLRARAPCPSARRQGLHGPCGMPRTRMAIRRAPAKRLRRRDRRAAMSMDSGPTCSPHALLFKPTCGELASNHACVCEGTASASSHVASRDGGRGPLIHISSGRPHSRRRFGEMMVAARGVGQPSLSPKADALTASRIGGNSETKRAHSATHLGSGCGCAFESTTLAAASYAP
mmetsp:Transcript_13242/g.28600  ORF Transcript_13242/g.28600 Transcript_13242/m.28600 type:complete len:241 (-) Transcript_13242:631-1353(-)